MAVGSLSSQASGASTPWLASETPSDSDGILS